MTRCNVWRLAIDTRFQPLVLREMDGIHHGEPAAASEGSD